MLQIAVIRTLCSTITHSIIVGFANRLSSYTADEMLLKLLRNIFLFKSQPLGRHLEKIIVLMLQIAVIRTLCSTIMHSIIVGFANRLSLYTADVLLLKLLRNIFVQKSTVWPPS